MLRIEVEQKKASRALVKAYGRLSAESLGALRDVVYDLLPRTRVDVDLEGVTTVDRAGIECLAALERDGVFLRKPSPFVRRWMKAEARAHLAKLLLVLSLFAGTPAGAEEPLTMDAAVAAAIANNRSLASARLETKKAEETLTATKTRRLPSLQFEVTGGQSLTPLTLEFEKGVFGESEKTGPIPDEDTEVDVSRTFSTIASARVTQPITQLWKIGLNVDLAESSLAIEREEERDARQETTRATKLAYFAVVQGERVAASAAETVTFHRELVRAAEQDLKRENVLEADLLQARAKLAGAELAERTAKDSLAVARQKLNRLLGRELDALVVVAGLPGDAPHAEAVHALRPDVRKSELQLAAANTDLRIEQASYIPDLSLTASYLRPIGVELVEENFTFAGVAFSWEPFTWGRREAEIREKRKAAEQAALALEETRTAAAIDVTERKHTLEQSASTIEVRRLEEEAAREKLRVVRNRYSQQAVELSDVLGSAASLADATTQREQALVDWWSAKIDYEKALGEE